MLYTVFIMGLSDCASPVQAARRRRQVNRLLIPRTARRARRVLAWRRSPRALALAALACPATLLAPPALAAAARAHAARSITLSDSGHLHLTGHRGFTLNEQGTASGTVSGSIYLHLHIVSVNHVTAEVNIYPSGGSITGHASASYHASGAYATFSGTMSVVRGTGRYARARGTGLSFTGTVKRSNDAVSVRVSGRMST
jgi:hypothetical protein